jgi:hypothetical protein
MWFDQRTVDSSGNYVRFMPNGKPLINGDGFFAQVPLPNTDSYNGVLTEQRLKSFLAKLKYESGWGGTREIHYDVVTGDGGEYQFDGAMKQYAVTTGAYIYTMSGAKVELGGTFRQYRYGNVSLTLHTNGNFSMPPAWAQDLDANGLPKFSNTYAFINTTTIPGESAPLEIWNKGAGGIDRSFVRKKIAGMIDIDNPSSEIAQTSADEYKEEFLSEFALINNYPSAHGVLYYS